MQRIIEFRTWGMSRQMTYFGLEGKPSSVYPEDPVMQYTGLKDKNGKEIYEGDIIDAVYGNRFEVWWSEKELRWETRNSIIINGALVNILEPEIIGNIYENPELLTQ